MRTKIIHSVSALAVALLATGCVVRTVPAQTAPAVDPVRQTEPVAPAAVAAPVTRPPATIPPLDVVDRFNDGRLDSIEWSLAKEELDLAGIYVIDDRGLAEDIAQSFCSEATFSATADDFLDVVMDSVTAIDVDPEKVGSFLGATMGWVCYDELALLGFSE